MIDISAKLARSQRGGYRSTNEVLGRAEWMTE